jgi:hypothetical protein
LSPVAPLLEYHPFDRHALRRSKPTRSLLKSVEAERLAFVLDRVERLCGPAEARAGEDRRIADADLALAPKRTQVVGRKRDRLVLLAPADIVFLSAEDGLIKARTAADT